MTERSVPVSRPALTGADRRWPAASSLPVHTDRPGYRAFSWVLLTVGVGVAVVTGFALPVYLPTPPWQIPILLAGFVVAERLTVALVVRRVDWAVSFTEVPLVVGLLVAPFPVVVGAHLLAGLLSQLRHRAWPHLPYRVGAMCLQIAVPYGIYDALRGALPAVPGWLLAAPAALASAAVSTVLALVALRVLSGKLRVPEALRLSGRTLVVGLLNTAAGLAGYRLIVSEPWGWVLVVLCLAALIPLYMAYLGLLTEQHDLHALAELSLVVARAGIAPDDADTASATVGWQAVADRIRDQLEVNRVLLHLRVDPSTGPVTLVSGPPLPEGTVPGGSLLLTDDPLLRSAGDEVRQLRLSDASAPVADALLRRGAEHVLVVPLRNATGLLGAVEAHDRLGRSGFSRADVRLLRTVAGHLASATDNCRLLGRLRHDAYHDPSTGLLNRAGFVSVAELPLQQHPESVVLRVDIDVLSTVSDALGQAWGDRMVVAAARRLREAFGPRVPLARLEAGSFAALLADCDADRAREVAERVRSEMSAPYPVDRLTVDAGVYVGYAAATNDLPGEQPGVDRLLQQADVALRAPRGSSAAIREYAPSMGQMFLRRFQLVTGFRQALENGEIFIHHQPKIALPGREVLGAEALVRWQHPEFGALDPDEFVPAVEATGLVDALTDFVTEQALAHVRKWSELGIRLTAAVNLSVRNLADESFPDRVAASLARHRLSASALTFELTESAVMSDPERALPVLERLRAMGVRLAVDDFGTGYSSLAYLRKLPVDEVKIDKSFVFGMSTSLSDLAVVRAIVELGHTLGLTVVAEGVEDDGVRDQLVEMGCDVAQGYLISRPLAEDRFAAWIQARTSAHSTGEDTVLTLAH